MSTDAEPQYRDLGRLSDLLQASIAIWGAIGLWSAWACWGRIDVVHDLIRGLAVSADRAAAADATVAYSSIADAIVILATAVIYLRWVYLTKRNAMVFGGSRIAYGAGWSVGLFFIPVLSLWKPYVSAQETFRASNPDCGQNWKDAPSPGLLRVWWALWLALSVLGQYIFRFEPAANDLAGLLTYTKVYLVDSLLQTALAVIVILLVAMLQRWQSAKFQALSQPIAGAVQGAGS